MCETGKRLGCWRGGGGSVLIQIRSYSGDDVC